MSNTVKSVVAALIAGLTALAAVVADGITLEEWIGVALAVLAALGGVGTYVQRQKVRQAKAEIAALKADSVKGEVAEEKESEE